MAEKKGIHFLQGEWKKPMLSLIKYAQGGLKSCFYLEQVHITEGLEIPTREGYTLGEWKRGEDSLCGVSTQHGYCVITEKNEIGNYPSGSVHEDLPYRYYALYAPIAKPTTLEDLFPEGQGQCWIVSKWDNGKAAKNGKRCSLIHEVRGDCHVMTNRGGMSFRCLAELGMRYTHHPLTPWEECKEFVV